MREITKHCDAARIEAAVRDWVEDVVVGLSLCPFVTRLARERQVRIHVSTATDGDALLGDLHDELELLDQKEPAEAETTIIVVPDLLADFSEYNDYLEIIDALLEHTGWQRRYQVASFHPCYQFADTEPDRSPWPLLHILREDSVSEALAHYPQADQISENNIRTVNALSAEERARRWPFLHCGDDKPV